MDKQSFPVRINKYLAQKGYATRKDADVLIGKGFVFINKKRAVLGDKVEEKDVVEVRGHTQKKHRYFAYNKPAGVVTHSPQFGEKEIRTATSLVGIFPVGRLDKKSHGLIILTDDARITDKLLNPDYVHEKEYRVLTVQELPSNFKARMEAGVTIDDYATKKCRVNIISSKKFSIVLTEGKKHQIRRMCAALRIDITDLERIRIMNIRLGSLKLGDHRAIEGTELQTFLSSLGLR